MGMKKVEDLSELAVIGVDDDVREVAAMRGRDGSVSQRALREPNTARLGI